MRDRSLVPSSFNTQDNLELGSEVADLVTWTEMAEGTSIGLTFDGATINMYGVFGGGVCMVKKDGVVVRRMAFAELMTRETVVNKMRKIQEYFAVGKAALQTLQHPMAHMLDIDRCGASLSDRGGADGVTHRSLQAAVIRRVRYKLGVDRWLEMDEDARVGALGDIRPSQWWEDGVEEAWADAQDIFDDEELNEHAVNPEHSARSFEKQSEFFQDCRAAIQLLGYIAYEDMPSSKQVVFVALFCLEHGQNNVLVAMDGAMDEVAREVIPGFLPDATPKSKAFVEVHKSPANKMLLGFGKTFAPCSDKDWARSFDFEGWEREKYNVYSLQDLQAILGSRFAIFFRNGRPLLRAWDHATEYLDEEKKCETSEGKMRDALTSAFKNVGLRANVFVKVLICDLVYWQWMTKMNAVHHPFDMAPPMQQAAVHHCRSSPTASGAGTPLRRCGRTGAGFGGRDDRHGACKQSGDVLDRKEVCRCSFQSRLATVAQAHG